MAASSSSTPTAQQLTDAANLIRTAEYSTLQQLQTILNDTRQKLNDLNASLPYPANFDSPTKRIATTIVNNIAYQTDTEVPGLVTTYAPAPSGS